MAQIQVNTSEKIYPIRQWLGLHESPDGDTKLKMGEAAVMENFKITRDGNLQRRYGRKTIATWGAAGDERAVRGLWSGTVRGRDYVLVAVMGGVYAFSPDFVGGGTMIGSMDTSLSVHFFGFGGDVYILNGQKYYTWDGTAFREVTGYVPVVLISMSPAGAGTELEQINKLTPKRRVWYSPDGAATVFKLPEDTLISVDSVINRATGQTISGYQTDLVSGTVTFAAAPAAGANTVEISYTTSGGYRRQVEAMRYSELYNGAQDSRVFLYGDGTNQVIYSGLDNDGNPRADYFPDMNVCSVGTENTPVTALVRHYSRLAAFKTDSAYSIVYGTITLEDGRITPGFYITPVNRTIGNAAMGQARLVLNSPRTLHGQDCYEWKNNSSYSSNLSVDERQAKRISDRVYATLATFDMANAVCWDDDYNQEYYIAFNGKALVHNYAVDAWYLYSSFPATCFCSVNGDLLAGTPDGAVVSLQKAALDDDGKAINARWESGAMSFGRDAWRKYSSTLWVGMKPQSSTYLEVSVTTDRKADSAVKTVITSSGGFSTWDFRTFSFKASAMSFVKKLKIKAKKFTYYKLVLASNEAGTTATVLSADMRVRTTGYVK